LIGQDSCDVDRSPTRFEPVYFDTFSESWRQVHPIFGRLICWMTFSAGAEFLAKGLCLLRGIEIRKVDSVLDYPAESLDGWVPRVTGGTAPLQTVPKYGSLGTLLRRTSTGPSAIERLCEKVNAPYWEQERLIAAFKSLAGPIRNRDAHAYRPNERDAHFWLVEGLRRASMPSSHGSQVIPASSMSG